MFPDELSGSFQTAVTGCTKSLGSGVTVPVIIVRSSAWKRRVLLESGWTNGLFGATH